MKTYVMLAMLLAESICFAQQAMTNLEDNLDTKIELNGNDDIDVQQLSDESAKIDRHKNRHTRIKQLDVQTLNVRSVRSVRPISSDGKIVDKLYVGKDRKMHRRKHVSAKRSDDIFLIDLSKSAIPIEYARAFGRSVRRAVKEVRISKSRQSKIFAIDASQYRWDRW